LILTADVKVTWRRRSVSVDVDDADDDDSERLSLVDVLPLVVLPASS